MNFLSALIGRVAWRRLRADPTYTLVVTLSVAVAGALIGLAGAWGASLSSMSLNYRSPEQLWFVQIQDRHVRERYGPEMQSSAQLVEEWSQSQKLFEDVASAQQQNIRLTDPGVFAGPSPRTIKLLTVTPNFLELTGAAIKAGRRPLLNAGEIAISEALANRRFESSAQAIGKMLEWNGSAYRIVGVLTSDFLAPSLLLNQRMPDDQVGILLPAHHVSRNPATPTLTESRAEEILLLGRSKLDALTLTRSADATLLGLPSSDRVSGLTIGLTPLWSHMRGNEQHLAALLALVATVLALATLAGIGNLALGRYRARKKNRFVSLAIGAASGARGAFEHREVHILIATSTMALCVLLAISSLILGSLPLTESFMTRSFWFWCATFVLGFMLTTYFVLALAVRTSEFGESSNISVSLAGRGAQTASRGGYWLRALVIVQTLIALMVMSVVLVYIADGWRAFRVVLANQYADVQELLIEYPEGLASSIISADLERLRTAASQLNEVQNVAISLAPALDLFGKSLGYSGPRGLGQAKLVKSEGGRTVFQMSSDGKPGGIETVKYQVSVVEAEPAYLSILGYRLHEGRAFTHQEEDVTVLTPSAAVAIFGVARGIAGETIPAAPRIDSADIWHGGLHVVGVIDAGRVGEGDELSTYLQRFPVAFVPYRIPSPPAGASQVTAYLLVKSRAGKGVDELVLRALLKTSGIGYTHIRNSNLRESTHVRLRGHLLASGGTLLLGLFVLLGSVAAAIGVTQFNCWNRRSEIAIRLAMGATERRLAWWLLRQELGTPALMILLWLVVAAFMFLNDSIPASLALSSLGQQMIAAGVVCFALLSGFVVGVRRPLSSSPMTALSEE